MKNKYDVIIAILLVILCIGIILVGTQVFTSSNSDNTIIREASRTFKNCENLTSLDLSNIDTSNTINMVEMFSNTLNLENLDIRNFTDNADGNYDKMFENINNGQEMTVIIDEDKCPKILKSLPENAKKEKPTNS